MEKKTEKNQLQVSSIIWKRQEEAGTEDLTDLYCVLQRNKLKLKKNNTFGESGKLLIIKTENCQKLFNSMK